MTLKAVPRIADGKLTLDTEIYAPQSVSANCSPSKDFSTYWYQFARKTPVMLAQDYVGVIDYKGGFLHRARVAVNNPRLITRFRINLPKFCKDVEIVEAGTVTEGVFDPAAAVDPGTGIFEVNQGQGARVGAIEVSLNGPASAQCAIPVFAELK